MRFASAAALLSVSVVAAGEPLAAIHQQRYSMGTMFDVIVYHESRSDASSAAAAALDEVVRLDRVLSHYRDDSDLARLVRGGRGPFVEVDPALYEVLEQSLRFSQLSGGRFDVTIAPLLKVWRTAIANQRRPTATEVEAARRCVDYRQIELAPPNRVRLASDCIEIDLGGIGKGYAVDRAMAILKAAGIRRALVNAGGSSILALGAPPGRSGWPVSLGGERGPEVLVTDRSVSTSQQGRLALPFAPGSFGEIVDPAAGAPLDRDGTVSVAAASATESDALSTTLLLLSPGDGKRVLTQIAGVSAVWMSPTAAVQTTYGAPFAAAGR
jgi:thiamine biosynthesis lipoprotein